MIYSDLAKRGDPVVPTQRAKYFTDALYNPLIRENLSRDFPGILDNAFASARKHYS